MTAAKKLIPWYKTQGVLGVTFKTKVAITEAMRSIVNRRMSGEYLSGADLAFVTDLLSHHPEWVEKQGAGVARIQVRLNRGEHFSNKGLWLLRIDDTSIDISWVVAIDAAPPSHDKLVRDAARHAIADQVQDARCSRLTEPCAICGLPIAGEVHVDHTAPWTFESIFAAWILGRAHVALLDAGLHPVFANEDDLADWQEYHRLFADLRRTHKHCNLSAKGTA